MKALTKEHLNYTLGHEGCSDPQCADHHQPLEELYFHGRCHPDSPTWVCYRKDGTLLIECAQCRKPIAVIQL